MSVADDVRIGCQSGSRPRRGARRLGLLAALLFVSAVGVGCGSSPTDPSPTRQTVAEGSQSGIPPYSNDQGVFLIVITTQVAGTLEGTVDWTLASNNIALVWGQGDCRANLDCSPLAQTSTTQKPKNLVLQNAQPGTYTLIVLNMGTTNESISYRVVLIG
jgi:hypothetical protein